MAELAVAVNPAGAVRGGNVVKQVLRDIKDAASGAQGSMVNFGATMGRVMGTGPALFVTGIAAMTAAAIAAAKSTASHIAEIQKFAYQTNLSTREAQMFAAMARQTGTDLNAMSGGMGKLNEHMQEAAKGSGESQRLFGALGVSVKDVNGRVRGTGEVFEEVVSKLGEFQSDGTKTTVISKLLGDEMQQMARVGKDGFKALSDEAKVMNSVLGEDSVKAAERFNLHMARTGAILEAWKLGIGEFALPKLNALMEEINKLVTGREMPELPSFGGKEGAGKLALPPDPAVLRRLLDEQTKQSIDAAQRQRDLANQNTDAEIANLKLAAVWRRDTSAAAMELMRAEHQMRIGNLIGEENKIRYLIELEQQRFEKSRTIGGVSDDERRLQDVQHGGVMADLKGKLTAAQGNTSLQAILFDADDAAAVRARNEDLYSWIQGELLATYQFGDDLRHRDQDNALAYYQNLAKFQEAYGTSRENQLTTHYDMVRASLAKELDVNQDTASKVLNAWRNGDHIHAAELLDGTRKTWDEITTIMFGAMAQQREISKRFSDDFFAGFADGMKKYVNDQSMLGLGVDQARRVAQGMEQSFGKFFFDAMEGRIQNFKDVVQGLVDFSKNITSQLAGTLVTNSLLRGFSAAMGGGAGSLFGGGGGRSMAYSDILPAHAMGGITQGPSLAGEAGPEAIVPLPNGRSIPVEWKHSPYASAMISPEMSMPVTVNVHNSANADVQTETRQGPDGNPQIDVFIKNVVKQGMRNGEFDGSMRQFGANRVPTRRG